MHQPVLVHVWVHYSFKHTLPYPYRFRIAPPPTAPYINILDNNNNDKWAEPDAAPGPSYRK
jgi:hypothetical protein